ncbi:hypothetical protein [Polyangium sp. 6x1]|uniref:hypothetical protein n=1 Tax=Polyangium sp. 6x1 TaxID=3042689 RepID=UPI0024823062|nr:hypothetical protein [Polyangium sp. 6x1]MDI1443706.1 hypothetical protein [Polyangium sp. 6x1]
MTVNVPPASADAPMIVKHPGCPEWGLGYLSEERDDKRFYDFEDGMSHSIAKAFWSKLEPVTLGAAEARALEKKVRGLKDQRSPSGKPKQKAVAPVLPNFDAQFALFLEIFPGGFTSARFAKEERGVEDPNPTAKKAKATRAIAMATARDLLARDVLDKQIQAGAFAEIVANVRAVHKAATGLLHPLGDIIPFGKMAAEHDRAVAEAVRDLLHGSDAYDARFDRLVAVLGKAKLATWPLATVLSALLTPEEHVFVKPSFYEKQAAMMSFPLKYERAPSAAAYERMRALVDDITQKLTEKGQAPRDKMDVYSFMARTMSPQQPPKKGA